MITFEDPDGMIHLNPRPKNSIQEIQAINIGNSRLAVFLKLRIARFQLSSAAGRTRKKLMQSRPRNRNPPKTNSTLAGVLKIRHSETRNLLRTAKQATILQENYSSCAMTHFPRSQVAEQKYGPHARAPKEIPRTQAIAEIQTPRFQIS